MAQKAKLNEREEMHMMNTMGLITATVILIFVLVTCGVLSVRIVNTIKESNKLRTKIKERRYLGFKDYTDAIMLVVLLVVDIVGMVMCIYTIGKIWGLF